MDPLDHDFDTLCNPKKPETLHVKPNPQASTVCLRLSLGFRGLGLWGLGLEGLGV